MRVKGLCKRVHILLEHVLTLGLLCPAELIAVSLQEKIFYFIHRFVIEDEV